MTLWVVLIALCLAALGFIVWPLYRSSERLTPLLAAVIVLTVGISAGLYHFIGNPNVPSGAGTMPDVNEMVTSLADRLDENPDDVDGWMMLGRSYQTMKNYDLAVPAFEKAVELEQGTNPQSLVALAIVLMEAQGGQMSERSAQLIESALTLDPENANALFYGGGAAARRGDTALAAERWEMLMAQNAPPELHELLQRQINEWRGLPPPAAVQQQGVISINLSVSAEALAALPADATVYVIARDPAQPSPPIAVTPKRLVELPALVALSDRDAMVQGRLLSGFTEIELVARVSLSGNPMAQSGDWSGSIIASTTGDEAVNLVIDQQIP